jgi:hypothetical protein
MTVLGKTNHRLPSIWVITHTISQVTSSCMEKNMILHITFKILLNTSAFAQITYSTCLEGGTMSDLDAWTA